MYKENFEPATGRQPQPSSIHSISLSPLGLCLLSISIPSEPARTRKGRHQPLIEHQFTGIRPFPISQLQASFEEFYNLRNILLWNVSARGELAFKGFLRYHPCKYSYEKTLDCIDSFKEVTCTVLIKELFFYTALIDGPFFSQLGLEKFDPIPCQSHKPTD